MLFDALHLIPRYYKLHYSLDSGGVQIPTVRQQLDSYRQPLRILVIEDQFKFGLPYLIRYLVQYSINRQPDNCAVSPAKNSLFRPDPVEIKTFLNFGFQLTVFLYYNFFPFKCWSSQVTSTRLTSSMLTIYKTLISHSKGSASRMRIRFL